MVEVGEIYGCRFSVRSVAERAEAESNSSLPDQQSLYQCIGVPNKTSWNDCSRYSA